VLPPLEVEVVAGESHQRPRAGNNSVHVELQPSSPPEPAPDTTDVARTDTPANITTEAADRVQMSADTDTVVSRSVKPGYPVLARQMKVQGSVILRALISKEGQIQDLRVLSGPPILASAAQEAVKQWHFKPHFVRTPWRRRPRSRLTSPSPQINYQSGLSVSQLAMTRPIRARLSQIERMGKKARAQANHLVVATKNNERPETLSSPGRPGSPPPELLTEEVKRMKTFCLWHFRAICTPKVPLP
jgi:TonB family protein